MKKIISGILAAAMAASALSVMPAFALDKSGDGMKIAVFGDSIPSGYGLDASEYTYGQLLADYYSGSVENFAVSGDETADTLAKIKALDENGKAYLASADTVIISSGANDMLHYSARYLLRMTARINCLVDGYTIDDIPERPGFFDATKLIDKKKMAAYVKNVGNAMAINNEFASLRLELVANEKTTGAEQYDQVINKTVVPNLKEITAEIKKINPDAKIVIQNLYDPLQFQPGFIDENYADWKDFFVLLMPLFRKTIESYNDYLKQVDGAVIADVYTDFTSSEKVDGNTLEYGWYFTKVQNDRKDLDIHPTQAGHVAIAATIINTLGEKSEDGGIFNQIFTRLPDKANYPKVALSAYDSAKGSYSLGDIDGNGVVDAADATKALVQYSLVATGAEGNLTATQVLAADVDKNGKADAADASKILIYYSFASTGGKGSFKNLNSK